MFSEFLSQNLLWVGAFMVVANLWVWSLLQGRVAGVGSVSALELPSLQRNKKSVIIDVNDSADFDKAHIADSKNFPIDTIVSQEASNNKDLMKLKDHTTVIVCQSGTKSAKAAKKLQELGFSDLHLLRGGLFSWTKENLPMVSS